MKDSMAGLSTSRASAKGKWVKWMGKPQFTVIPSAVR